MHSELEKDSLDVMANGVRADTERAGNYSIAVASGQAQSDLCLTSSEPQYVVQFCGAG